MSRHNIEKNVLEENYPLFYISGVFSTKKVGDRRRRSLQLTGYLPGRYRDPELWTLLLGLFMHYTLENHEIMNKKEEILPPKLFWLHKRITWRVQDNWRSCCKQKHEAGEQSRCLGWNTFILNRSKMWHRKQKKSTDYRSELCIFSIM